MAKKTTSVYEVNVPEPVVPTITNRKRGTVFTASLEGPGNYRDVGARILKAQNPRLSLLSGEQTAHMLEVAYHDAPGNEIPSQLQDVRNAMVNNYLWMFQRDLWVPGGKPGVYVVSDPTAIGLSESLDPDRLEHSLKGSRALNNGVRFSKDKSVVAFAPRESYNEGNLEENDGFAQASFGVLGARSFVRTGKSEHFNEKPYSWIVSPSGSEPIQTLSAVYDSNGRLLLDGYFNGSNRNGFSSGVFSTGEASCEK
jgi:hypothetical protein